VLNTGHSTGLDSGRAPGALNQNSQPEIVSCFHPISPLSCGQYRIKANRLPRTPLVIFKQALGPRGHNDLPGSMDTFQGMAQFTTRIWLHSPKTLKNHFAPAYRVQ